MFQQFPAVQYSSTHSFILLFDPDILMNMSESELNLEIFKIKIGEKIMSYLADSS